MLRALMEHPRRAGDPVALTVNFCAPIAEGDFDLDVRLIKANRSSQHWYVELSQGGADVATIATAIFAERRPSWSHQVAPGPESKPFAGARPLRLAPATWVEQYDMRFVEGFPVARANPAAEPGSAFSKLWIGDHVPWRCRMRSSRASFMPAAKCRPSER
jgi:Thioesterase-like superfamily